jgi:hypothetical protein
LSLVNMTRCPAKLGPVERIENAADTLIGEL